MSLRGGDRSSKPLVTPAPAIAGMHRASARGQVNLNERPPGWAQRSPAAMTVWQVARYGLAHNMTAHEHPVLVMALQQMLREQLPGRVRTQVRTTLTHLGVSKRDMPNGPPRQGGARGRGGRKSTRASATQQGQRHIAHATKAERKFESNGGMLDLIKTLTALARETARGE